MSLISGYYAIKDPKDDILKFYKIDVPTKGKWANYTFVSVQASEDLYPIKDRYHREQILNAIEQDPIESLKRYGIEIGRCSICGRTLTDQISRQRGIGPICWSLVSISQ